MRLNRQQRIKLHAMFGGRCAYCGQVLGERWHADHVAPILREWWNKSGGMERPQNDTLGNLMPACAPCNIDKHRMTLEDWRRKLQSACDVLQRNQPTYRHAVRFGLLTVTAAPVVFHFERQAHAGDDSEGRA